jgi:glutamate synthase (NADPH/NADH) small chain
MGASLYEQKFAQTGGVTIRHWAAPTKLLVSDRISGVEFARTELDANGKLVATSDTWSLDADIVFKAVGQALDNKILGPIASTIEQRGGKLLVDAERKTSLQDVWAGGDCIYGHDDLTVSAVQDGKLAATGIDRYLRDRSG